MAQLPITCDNCGQVVFADPERKAIECPSCNQKIYIYKAIPVQHPKYYALCQEEQKLVGPMNDNINEANDYQARMSSVLRRNWFFIPLAIMITCYYIVLLTDHQLYTPKNFGEVLFLILATTAVLAAYTLPWLIPLLKKKKEKDIEMGDKKAQGELMASRITEILIEKEQYLQKYQQETPENQ